MFRKIHPDAKATALRRIEQVRKELEASARPVSDAYLAKVGAEYVGAKVGDVLAWMKAA